MNKQSVLYLTQGSGNSFKPMLVAAHLGLNCQLKYVDVLAGESRRPDFLSINPQGVLPYMTLPDGSGLGESNAIAWYLAEGSPLIPNTALSRAQAIQWMNFEQTSLEPNISPVRFFTFIVPDMKDAHADMIPVWRERGNKALALLDDCLATRDFVTEYGYSVADIAVFGYTHLANEGGFNLDDYKHVSAWIKRVEAQPGYVAINDLLSGNETQLAA